MLTVGNWIQVYLGGTGKVVNKYAIKPGSGYTYQGWRGWILYGSNNGSSWTAVHTVTGFTGWTSGYNYWLNIGNVTAYRYYRVTSTQFSGSYSMGIMRLQLSE